MTRDSIMELREYNIFNSGRNFEGLYVVTLSKRNFSLLDMPNTISVAVDFKELTAYSKVRTYTLRFLTSEIIVGRELSIMHSHYTQRPEFSPPISAWY